jgi:hypothetical protein
MSTRQLPTDVDPRKVKIALDLFKLGVSGSGVQELLLYDLDLIERQLAWLPYRKAKRPEAMIIDAIRNNYSAPNAFSHATPQTSPAIPTVPLDQDAEQPPRPLDAGAQGYGTADSSGAGTTDNWLAAGGSSYDLDLPDTRQEDGPQ